MVGSRCAEAGLGSCLKRVADSDAAERESRPSLVGAEREAGTGNGGVVGEYWEVGRERCRCERCNSVTISY
jgi:hypothetical protein